MFFKNFKFRVLYLSWFIAVGLCFHWTPLYMSPPYPPAATALFMPTAHLAASPCTAQYLEVRKERVISFFFFFFFQFCHNLNADFKLNFAFHDLFFPHTHTHRFPLPLNEVIA